MAATVGCRQTTSPKRSRRGSSRSCVVEELQHLDWPSDLQEGGEDQVQPVLHLLVGIFDHPAQRVADQPDGQVQGQLAALGLVEQAGGQAGPDGVEFQFGELALQAQEKPPVGRAGIVDAVPVADQAAPVAAQVEQRIPVGAVAGQAGDVVGEDDARPGPG